MLDITTKYRILIYQTDEKQTATLKLFFKVHGFEVITANDSNIMSAILEGLYDLCILDASKDEYKPYKYLSAVRSGKLTRLTPIIIVSDFNNLESMLSAFKLGADDCVAKPYNMEELMWRIKAIIRRTGLEQHNIASEYNIGLIKYYPAECKLASPKGYETLTEKENSVLLILCTQINRVIPIGIILQKCWQSVNTSNKAMLSQYIRKIREKLADDPAVSIEKISRVGYMLKVPIAAQ